MKQYPILIEKIQLSGVREKKNWSHEDSKQTIMAKTGVAMKEKRITKKIANMKSQLKKKINWWNENRK